MYWKHLINMILIWMALIEVFNTSFSPIFILFWVFFFLIVREEELGPFSFFHFFFFQFFGFKSLKIGLPN